MKDWLIAHRGAQSDGRENTLAAFRACQKYPLGWVELDLHVTKDNIVVCHHDFGILGQNIVDLTYTELLKLDPELTTFDEALAVLDPNLPLIVEIKATGVAKHVYKIILANPIWRMSSYYPEALEELVALGVNRKRLNLLQYKHTFGQLKKTLLSNYGGVGLKRQFATPLLLWRCHRKGLYIYLHTVNYPFYARILRRLYPYVHLCTNRPDRLQNLR